ISVGVAAIVLSFRMYQKYRLKYLMYYFLSLLFGYAFAFLDVVASYLAQGILIYGISPHSTVKTVRLVFSMLAFPFIILAWFFFISMVLEWLGKKFSWKLKSGYFLLQIILIIAYALTVNRYAVMPEARIAELSSWTIFVFNALNLGILCLVIFTAYFHSRTMEKLDKRKAIRIFATIYLVVFILHFVLLSLLRKYTLLCYMHPSFEFFMHIPPLLYLLTFLKSFYKNHALHPVTEQDIAINFAKHKISERELEIIRLILEGKSNHDIENELYISLKTVKTHVYNIYRKLGVKNRWQLINLAQNIISSR
ncbi:hypothetical protein KA005_42630, partial [bacterium]|nr:hypothetical protein [bacterium]